MKTLEEIIKQEPIYLNDFGGKIDVISEFKGMYMSKKEYEAESAPYKNKNMWLSKKAEMKTLLDSWEPIHILLASYGTGSYEGDTFVLFERDGKLFEVNGSHCSCYGLENQFDPEETSLEALKHRLVEGKLGKDNYCGNEFSDELKQFLGI
mgnify:CR=1 FL=1